ncbi:hypothetical protein WJX84_012045 [Apatococcus fuscideae]|uniref:CW-type domain-containing protein n=1 Tax=Apatococcus fuscideae TaxID=2026836 RepID=A0AAW1SLW4_9CHLO
MKGEVDDQEAGALGALADLAGGFNGMSNQGRSAQGGRAQLQGSMANESDLEPSDEDGEIEGQGQSKAPKHPQDMQKWVQCARCNCWRKVPYDLRGTARASSAVRGSGAEPSGRLASERSVARAELCASGDRRKRLRQRARSACVADARGAAQRGSSARRAERASAPRAAGERSERRRGASARERSGDARRARRGSERAVAAASARVSARRARGAARASAARVCGGERERAAERAARREPGAVRSERSERRARSAARCERARAAAADAARSGGRSAVRRARARESGER